MKIKQPSLSIVFNRKNYASLTKKASVEIRICYEYKQKFFSTGIMLYSNQWKNGMIVNCPDSIQLSKILTKQLTDIRQVLSDMIEEEAIDLNLIPYRLNRLTSNQIGFVGFCKERADIRKYGKAKNTQGRYERFLRFFKAWGKIKEFNDINEQNIIAFDKCLKKTGMNNCSKWTNYHRFLNSFIIDAIKSGYLKSNPYTQLNINKGDTTGGIDKCLTPSQFKIVREAKMPTESLEKIRDLFIFQTYTCLRYSDLADFNTKYIQEINGMKTYIRAAKKTKKQFTVPLLPTALEILNKYSGRLPIISNVKYNLYLKSVAQHAGLDIPLSTHCFRHTGATLLLNEGVDMKIVSKICGHSSTRITEQIYAKLLDETVVEAVKRLK